MPSYLHSGDLGDLVGALPIIQMLGGGKLYLTTGGGAREAMTPARIEFIKPLLLAQPYIDGVEEWKGQNVAHDFTGFREGYVTDVPVAVVQNRHVSPFKRADFKAPWLTVPGVKQHGRPVYSRTARYHHPDGDALWRRIIRRYPNALFVGTKDEYETFEAQFHAGSELVPISTSMDIARAIAGSTMFCGNQSFPNAVAEGLKHNCIVEHCLQYPDMFWPRDNAVRIRSGEVKDWPFSNDGRVAIMLALQVYPGDIDQGMELARLIVEIEPEFRADVEVAVCVRDDTDAGKAEVLRGIFGQRFTTHLIRSKRFGRGWPEGCNDLWQSSMMQLGKLHREGKTQCECVLTYEVDCLPMRLDWIADLQAAWMTAKDAGKFAFGTVHNAGGTAGWHINGNMVLDIRATKMFPQLQSADGPWDCYHNTLFMEHGMDSPTIVQLYRDNRNLTPEDFASIRKSGRIPALLHGIKHPSRFASIRRFLFEPPPPEVPVAKVSLHDSLLIK